MAGSPHKRVVPPDDDDEEEEVEAMDAVIGEDEDDNGDDDGVPTTHLQIESHSVLLAHFCASGLQRHPDADREATVPDPTGVRLGGWGLHPHLLNPRRTS